MRNKYKNLRKREVWSKRIKEMKNLNYKIHFLKKEIRNEKRNKSMIEMERRNYEYICFFNKCWNKVIVGEKEIKSIKGEKEW